MDTNTAEYYGEDVLQVEPHGIDPILKNERHGKPRNIFTLWFSANLEFATLTLGVLAVSLFGLNLAQATMSIVIGTALGAFFIGLLTTFGYRWGVPQLIQSRAAFGFYGNFVPALFNFVAGVGWYAVNTVLGVFALQWLLPIGFVPDLIIMILIQAVVSIYGHNLIHFVEKAAALFLAIIFIILTIYALKDIHFNFAENLKAPLYSGTFGSIVLTIGTTFSYMLGWLTFSSDYSRYLPKETPFGKAFGFAFFGNFIPAVWLELLGAGLATVKPFISTPTDLVTGLMPHVIVVFTMIAIMIGTITANVLNIYSGSLSLLAIDVKWMRAIAPKRWVAALFIGILGGLLSYFGGSNGYYNNYSNFLLLLAYWISPWLAIVVTDYMMFRRKREDVEQFYEGSGKFKAGIFAFILAIAVSVPFFNQAVYVGAIAQAHPQMGDISYYVSFFAAMIFYAIFSRFSKNSAEKNQSNAA